MSEQHISIWKSCAEAFSTRFDAITEDQWAADTPCAGWSVKDLVEHSVGVQSGWIGQMLGVEVGEGAEWPAVRDAIDAALAGDGALDGTVDLPGMGTVPKTVPLGIASSDMLIHAWDLARAIGADESLPAEAVSAAYAGLQRFPEETMRGEGMFGAAVQVADDADEQTKMLSFTGRAV